jgi:ATP/maltotriose-dependent transcriptional regulator MalT
MAPNPVPTARSVRAVAFLVTPAKRGPRHSRRPSGTDDLARARDAYARHAWNDAYEAFARAERAGPLRGEDLQRYVWSAGLTDRGDEILRLLELLYQSRLDAHDQLGAARAAFWLGFRLSALNEMGRASAWLARSRHLVESAGGASVEQGYLLLPEVHRLVATGDVESAHRTAVAAAEIGQRFHDADLVAFAQNQQGRTLVQLGRYAEGLAQLDQAMLAATSGRLLPLFTGLIYCSVIECCQRLYALDRASEWTAALNTWCDSQPQLAAFSGTCRVHRSEILQLHGDWAAAVAEADRVVDRLRPGVVSDAAAAACYQRAEIHRLRGEFPAAEAAYRRASEFGREPQPGLALMRLAQGRTAGAATTIRRVLDSTTDALARVQFLPAAVEVLVAAGEMGQARAVANELDEIAGRYPTAILGAVAAQARGTLALCEGNASGAVTSLRHAFAVWQDVGAPYAAARARVSIGKACRALGDDEGAGLEWNAARAAFRDLGATPDLARLDELSRSARSGRPGGLTPRELQVLRLVATGKTNKAIGSELRLAEKTVDRHVSNIFQKLDVSSRAAATAHAYRHRLI